NAHLRRQIERFGVEVFEIADFDADRFDPKLIGPLYISFDLDALDPAFAPGVSHHEPGGLTVRQALTILQKQQGDVLGADIVEYNPNRDINDMTGAVAAKLLKEIAALMLRN
ncbi:MAG: arginase family protein, partial [Gammaproteobacteria bacterium]|nr:arginase family protein [Gammaproteobacteria bacterium]